MGGPTSFTFSSLPYLPLLSLFTSTFTLYPLTLISIIHFSSNQTSIVMKDSLPPPAPNKFFCVYCYTLWEKVNWKNCTFTKHICLDSTRIYTNLHYISNYKKQPNPNTYCFPQTRNKPSLVPS